MSKSENIKAFEAALKEDKDLRETYEAALKRISKNKEASSDGEALVKAAAEVGFPLTMDALERKQAENEELSDHDLEMVSGGTTSSDTFCWVDYSCDYIYRTEWNDQSESGQTHTKFGKTSAPFVWLNRYAYTAVYDGV